MDKRTTIYQIRDGKCHVGTVSLSDDKEIIHGVFDRDNMAVCFSGNRTDEMDKIAMNELKHGVLSELDLATEKVTRLAAIYQEIKHRRLVVDD